MYNIHTLTNKRQNLQAVRASTHVLWISVTSSAPVIMQVVMVVKLLTQGQFTYWLIKLNTLHIVLDPVVIKTDLKYSACMLNHESGFQFSLDFFVTTKYALFAVDYRSGSIDWGMKLAYLLYIQGKEQLPAKGSKDCWHAQRPYKQNSVFHLRVKTSILDMLLQSHLVFPTLVQWS